MSAYIVSATRTAGGKRDGQLAHLHPVDLGATVINSLLAKVSLDPALVDDVIIGCVTQAGEQTSAFARNIVLASDLPNSVPGVTIDRQCGSSQQAIQFAAQAVMSGTQDIVIAGGVESMSRAPMFSQMSVFKKAGLPHDPLSPRIKEKFNVDTFSQFHGAELIAQKHHLSREMLDEFALSSHMKAIQATQNGLFEKEITPIQTAEKIANIDEGIRFNASLESISQVKPIFENGVITAANASQICDGASAVLVVSERALAKYNLVPIARIVDMTITAGDPVIMLEEPIRATQTSLKKAGLHIDDIDLYEVNEAFAPIPLAWLSALHADPEKLNVYGGAIALGHPLGASGTKLMTTLLNALEHKNGKYGLLTMCEGGGMANVTIVEKC